MFNSRHNSNNIYWLKLATDYEYFYSNFVKNTNHMNQLNIITSKLTPPELKISDENPFENCKLNREQYANILTPILKTYKDGFVLALNNKWGTGKTTFVKMWQIKLQDENEGFKTLYFNAWEHDTEQNSLPALLAELKSLQNNDNPTFQNVLVAGAKIGNKALPVFTKLLLKQIGIEFKGDLSDLLKKVAEGVEGVLDKQIKEYDEKKEKIKDFKEELGKYIKTIDNDKPIVFFIDELDWCRPSFAVEVLEQIKHFFSVPGIVFVLSIDKVQLGHSIRGAYGSDRLDAEEYLRRFIDLEYSLPQPSVADFWRYLIDNYNLNSYFLSEERKNHTHQQENDILKNHLTIFFEYSELSLRQIEKVFIEFSLFISNIPKNRAIYPEAILFLILTRTHHPNFFNNFILKSITPQELLDRMKLLFPKDKTIGAKEFYLSIETALVCIYSSLRTHGQPSNHLLSEDSEDKLLSSASGVPIVSLQRSIQNFCKDNNFDNKRMSKYIDQVQNLGGIKN